MELRCKRHAMTVGYAKEAVASWKLLRCVPGQIYVRTIHSQIDDDLRHEFWGAFGVGG